MRKIIPQDPACRGLLPAHPGLPPTAPFNTWISCNYFARDLELIDVPPWGIVLPGDALNYPNEIFFILELETVSMVPGTELAIRWTPADGTNIHVLRRTLNGSPDSIRQFVPASWLEEAQGQNVLIEFEALPPDGNGYPGRSFSVRVTDRIVVGDTRIADLSDGDTIDPDKYPDGLQGSIDPIGHVEEHNYVSIDWTVLGYTANGTEVLHQWWTEWPGVPNQPYEFVVHPEAYSGFDDPRFHTITVSFRSFIKLVPRPNREFVFSMGGQTFTLPTATRR